AVYMTRAYLLPAIPEQLFSIGEFVFTKALVIMLLFAIVMIFAAISMIRPCVDCEQNTDQPIRYSYPILLLEGSEVGVITGMVGAGGGFLIIPALVLLAKMPIKIAVGTSLFIIAGKSLLGFLGDLKGPNAIDWSILSIFT